MTRAVLESVGFAVRDVVAVMEEKGLAVEDMRVTGGQARSPLWNQVKADITGKRILVAEAQDAELVGDASWPSMPWAATPAWPRRRSPSCACAVSTSPTGAEGGCTTSCSASTAPRTAV